LARRYGAPRGAQPASLFRHLHEEALMNLRLSLPTRVVVGALHLLLYGAVLWGLPNVNNRGLAVTDIEICTSLFVFQFMWAQAWLRPVNFLGRTAVWGYRPYIDYAFAAGLIDFAAVLIAPKVGPYHSVPAVALIGFIPAEIIARVQAVRALAQEIGDLPIEIEDVEEEQAQHERLHINTPR
jgi:hypothetical protein